MTIQVGKVVSLIGRQKHLVDQRFFCSKTQCQQPRATSVKL